MGFSRKFSKRRFFKCTLVYFLTCCMFFNTSLSVVLAGQEGAQVINGQVSFQQSGYNTTITASDKSIINYSSFDIARPEIVQFIQPHSNASVLNRILSANPTNINGTLLANGRVFFVNPAGVYIGAGARVSVNQLVASGLNITNSDFINGQYNFAGGNGSVVNSGDISAKEVYLIGRQVTNSGNISCPGGYVVMASGDRVFLGEPGTDVVLEMDTPDVPDPAQTLEGSGVLNEGTIDAAGGTIVLAAGDIYSQAISNTGSLSASVETGDAGQITLTADGGTVINSGSIEAKSDSGKGGTVQVLGDRVGLFDAAEIDASGSNGGGTILIGGDYQGKGEIPTASRTYVSEDSTIKADATENGDGGKVIVWSDETTRFYGDISARGGAEGGDGGFVEVSGKDNLGFYGYVDTLAPQGNIGTLLLDPEDIVIAGGTGTSVGLDEVDAFDDPGTTLTITEKTLEDASSHVKLQAEDSITVSGTFNYDGNGEGTGSIVMLDNNLNLTMETRNATGEGSGGIDLTGVGVEFQTQGTGNITIRAGVTGVDAGGDTGSAPITVGKLTTLGSGSVVLDAEGTVTVNDAINATGSVDIGGSSITVGDNLTAGADITFNDSLTLTADVIAAGANVEFASTVDGGQNLTVNSSGATKFGSTVGSTTNLTSLTTDAGGTTSLGGDVTTTGDQTYNDDVTVANGTTLKAGNDVVLADGKTLTGAGSLTIEATNGEIKAAGAGSTISVTGSWLTLKQAVDLDLANFTFGNQSSTDLTAQSYNGSFTADNTNAANAADQWQSITATVQNGITLEGSSHITTKALTTTTGNISVHSTAGNLILIGAVNADPVSGDSLGGGVELIADTGKIYTPGGADDTLNVAITGYSDADALVGVDLPFLGNLFVADKDKKAAIVIWSLSQDLKLGPGATLTADGAYYGTADDISIDDRLSVAFLYGDPVDVAIYLSSANATPTLWGLLPTGGTNNVTVDSARVSINNTTGVGTLVVDADDTVKFPSTFDSSLAIYGASNVERIEVVSRVSPDLETAIGPPEKLPDASSPAFLAGGLFDGTYVLRGWLEPSFWRFVDILGVREAVPIVVSMPVELEIQSEVEEPDFDAIAQLLDDLGIGAQPFLARAYRPSLNTDLSLFKAAEKLLRLGPTLEDADGTRITALIPLIRGISETPVPVEEQMTSFVQELARQELAGQWINALTEYTAILNNEIGLPADDSVARVMVRYGDKLTGPAENLFVEEYLAQTFAK